MHFQMWSVVILLDGTKHSISSACRTGTLLCNVEELVSGTDTKKPRF